MTDLESLILSIRHPAHEIDLAANTAYWMHSQGSEGVDYQVSKILEEAEKLARCADSIRRYVLDNGGAE